MLVTTPAARTGLRLRERPDGPPANMRDKAKRGHAIVMTAVLVINPVHARGGLIKAHPRHLFHQLLVVREVKQVIT